MITNTYVTGSVQFAGSKTLNGKALEAGQFSFTLVSENDDVDVTVTNAADGSIDFPVLKYNLNDAGKTFTYTVKETIPAEKQAGIIYDESEYTVTVTVVENSDGTLSVVPSANYNALAFTNSFIPDAEVILTAKKLVNGKQPSDSQVYQFVLKDEDEKTLQTVSNKLDKITFEAIRYSIDDIGKTYTYTICEAGESTADMVMDDTMYTVTVRIGEPVDGQLDVRTEISISDEPVDEILFSNLGYGTLSISKNVDNMFTEETFDITVRIYEANGEESKRAFPCTGDPEDEIQSGDVIQLADGQEIVISNLLAGMRYEVSEKECLRYTTTVNGVAGNGVSEEFLGENAKVEFVNSIVMTSLSVKKRWEGGGDDDIVLTLYANGEKLLAQPGYTREGNTYTYENLPKFDENGDEILYGVKEQYVDGFMTMYVNTGLLADETAFAYDGATIINRASMSFAVKKVWEGLGDGETPPAIKLTLYCNGEAMNKKTPEPNADGWYIYSNLPLIYKGERAVYTAVEEYMPGYYTSYQNPDGSEAEYATNGGTIINYKYPPTGEKNALAMWAAMLAASGAALTLAFKRRRRKA